MKAPATLELCDRCAAALTDGPALREENGNTYCERCVEEKRAGDLIAWEGVETMLRAAIAGALRENMPAERLREIVEAEIEGWGQGFGHAVLAEKWPGEVA